MWKMTVDPRQAPDEPEDFSLHFDKGIPTKLVSGGKEVTDPVELFLAINAIGHRHGVGRIDIIESRYDTSGLEDDMRSIL